MGVSAPTRIAIKQNSSQSQYIIDPTDRQSQDHLGEVIDTQAVFQAGCAADEYWLWPFGGVQVGTSTF